MADLPSVNAFEIETFKKISQSTADGPVFMLNLNKYRVEAHYPDGQLYKDYMAVLDALLLQVGGEILWRTKVLGHVVGNQDIDDSYPRLGETVTVTSTPYENVPYSVRIKYTAYGQTQYQHVHSNSGGSPLTTSVILWTTSGLAYSNMVLQVLHNEQVKNEYSRTIYP